MTEPALHQIDLRQLRALRAVIRAGSFRGAGARLGYTQSAISQQIKALEHHVGRQLLDRTGTGAPATPTAVGWIVLRHAEAVLARIDRLGDELAELDARGAETVHVGFFPSIGATLLPRVVREVARTLPEVQLVLSECECDQDLQARVATGELDLCFALAPVVVDVLAGTRLFEDPTVVLTRADDPLAAGPVVSAAGLRDRRLASFGPSPHQQAVEDTLRDVHGAAVAIRADDNATLARLVATGSAVAVMSRLSAHDAMTGGLIATDAPGLPARTVVLVRHRERLCSPLTAAVARIVADACADDAVPLAAAPQPSASWFAAAIASA